jgi:DNA-binding HxlR family transcriptional regulator
MLLHLSDDPRRFGELRRRVTGINDKVLIRQLREMEADGIVTHAVAPHACVCAPRRGGRNERRWHQVC